MSGALRVAESKRLRRSIRIATAIHATILSLLAWADALLVPSVEGWVAATFLLGAAGFALGLVQWGAYGSGERWIFLLHRPLSPRRIFGEVASAGMIAVAIAVTLPLGIAAMLATLADPHGGTWRLFAPAVATAAVAAFYFAGALFVLRPWRGVALTAMVALALLVPARTITATLLQGVAVALLLAATACLAMRPDLRTSPRPGAGLALGLAPALLWLFHGVAFALLLVYSLGVGFVEEGWRGPARFSWNHHFPPGTLEHVGYLASGEAIRHGLERGSDSARRALAEIDPAADEAGTALDVPIERGSWFRGPREIDVVSGSGRAYRLTPTVLEMQLPGETHAAWTFPVAGDRTDLTRVVVAESGDATWVSVITGRRAERELTDGRQSVWRIDRSGGRDLVADEPLVPGPPAWIRHRGFVISPILQMIDDVLRSTLREPGERTARAAELASRHPPPNVLGLAGVVALACAAWAYAAGGRRGLPAGEKRAWTVAALCLGVPVLLAQPLFTSRRR